MFSILYIVSGFKDGILIWTMMFGVCGYEITLCLFFLDCAINQVVYFAKNLFLLNKRSQDVCLCDQSLSEPKLKSTREADKYRIHRCVCSF